MSDPSADNASRLKAVALIAIAVVALGVYLVLLHQWPESAASSSMLLPILGFSMALCTGVALGKWWPSMRADSSTPATNESSAPEELAEDATATVHTDDTPTVSALMEEEHIPGAAKPLPPAPEPEPEPDTHTSEAGHDEQIEQRIKPSMHASVAIDDRPRDEAMAAKDEVIRSLENIVKENRDRWADFEQDREDLEAKIRNLESELRIAHQIIENGSDEPDVFVPPQVLTRA